MCSSNPQAAVKWTVRGTFSGSNLARVQTQPSSCMSRTQTHITTHIKLTASECPVALRGHFLDWNTETRTNCTATFRLQGTGQSNGGQQVSGEQQTKPQWSHCYMQLLLTGRPFPCPPSPTPSPGSNKTDLLKYISHTAAAWTSNVSQSEIKYSILFGTSQANLIFLPCNVTQGPSMWSLEDVLSFELD